MEMKGFPGLDGARNILQGHLGRQGKCGISQRSGKTGTEHGRDVWYLKKCRLCLWCHCAELQGNCRSCVPWEPPFSSLPAGTGSTWSPALARWKFLNPRDLLGSPTKCNILTKALQHWCSAQKTPLACRMGSNPR